MVNSPRHPCGNAGTLKGGGVTCSRCLALPTTRFSIIGRNTLGLPEGPGVFRIIARGLGLTITGRNAKGLRLIIATAPYLQTWLEQATRGGWGLTHHHRGTILADPAREGHYSQSPVIRNPLRTVCNMPSYPRPLTREGNYASPG